MKSLACRLLVLLVGIIAFNEIHSEEVVEFNQDLMKLDLHWNSYPLEAEFLAEDDGPIPGAPQAIQVQGPIPGAPQAIQVQGPIPGAKAIEVGKPKTLTHQVPGCDVSSWTDHNAHIDIVVIISQCIPAKYATGINQWLTNLKQRELRFLKSRELTYDVNFNIWISKECQAQGDELFTWKEPHFVGQVLDASKFAAIKPEVVITFISDNDSYKAVNSYETQQNIKNVLNFQVKIDKVTETFKDCVILQKIEELFSYDPFKAVQRYHCTNTLPGGVAVTYLDATKKRKCMCTCPIGYQKSNGKCVPTAPERCMCAWTGRDFIRQVSSADTTNDKCVISNLYSTFKYVPFPVSNYVSDNRVNLFDTSSPLITNGPRVEVVLSSKTDKSIISRASYAWSYFQTNRNDIIDKLSLSAPGLYSIELIAWDYDRKANCESCLAIVDTYRPQATTKCPVEFCSDDVKAFCQKRQIPIASYTPEGIAAAQQLAAAHYQFSTLAKNDGCSSNNRCDNKVYARKDFFSQTYDPVVNFDEGKNCFTDAVAPNSLLQLQKSPFGDKGENLNANLPIEPGLCTRCCRYSTTLQEKWYDYKCGQDAPESKCSGTDKCANDQCIMGFGNSFFTASAKIVDSYANKTARLIQEEFPKEGYNSITEIHIKLPCNKLNETTSHGLCAFTKSVSNLLQVSSAIINSSFIPGNDATQYVQWRYRIAGQDWKDFKDATPFTFAESSTSIELEAWSRCGLVHRFVFLVRLHTESKTHCSDTFDYMWDNPTGLMCNYDRSDFGLLTFDYDTSMCLENHKDFDNTGLTCWIQFDQRQQALLFEQKGKNEPYIRRLGINMVENSTTDQFTGFEITCAFFFQNHFGEHKRTFNETVRKHFTLKNCDPPAWDCPWGVCSNQCPANLPGPHEMCRGHQVSSDATTTIVRQLQTKCCDKCGPATCTPILGLPNKEDDISRCTVKLYAPSFMENFYQTLHENVYLTGMIAVGGVVGLMAFALRRRELQTQNTVAMVESYHPLLG